MATPGSTILNIGAGAGQNHFKLDYSTTAGGGVTAKTQTELTTFELANIFFTSPSGTECIMKQGVVGDPIAANGYPRTELRELATDGTTLRAFNPTTNDHWLMARARVYHLPPKKPSVVIGQMHDNLDDVIEIAVQPVTGYDETTNPVVEVVCRINGSSRVQTGVDGNGDPVYYTWPKLIAAYEIGTEIAYKIRVGATFSYQVFIGDMSTPVLTKASHASMPALNTSGTNSYWKIGCYNQTKHTSNGTGGLETNSAEYCQVGFREMQVFHTSETAPIQLTYGTNSTDAISTVRWGTKVSAVNTGATSPAPLTITMSPPFPTSAAPSPGELVFVVLHCRRGTTSVVATPTIDSATYPGWTRLFTIATATGGGAGGLSASTIRYQLWVAEYVPGMAVPAFTLTSGAASDTVHAQMGCASGVKYGIGASDQIGTLGVATTNTTTTLGPAPALGAAVPAGGLILALLDHEFTKASGTLNAITGDSLTWAEAAENIVTWAFVTDWALNPTAVTPVQKTLATTSITTGLGCGLQTSLLAAQKRTAGMIPCTA